MAHSPFESWKRRAPSDGDEAQAAKLIQKLGDADALSPQALHRVAHRLRAPERRHLSLFSDVRLAAASVAVLVLFVLGAWATVGFFDRQSGTTTLAARQRPVQQLVATNDAPATAPATAPTTAPATAPDVEAKVNDQRSGLRLGEPELFRGNKAGRSGLLDTDADVQDARPTVLTAKKAAPHAEPQVELAMRDQSSGGVRSLAGQSVRAAAPSAAAAPAPPSDGTVLSGMSVEGCRSTLPVDSTTLARNEGDLEQALFRHGACLLLMGKRTPGINELQTSLERYPNGRFAEGIRALLLKNLDQSSGH